MKVGADDPAAAFTVQEVAGLRDVEELVDTAMARTRYEDGYVESITVTRGVSAPEINVAVSSPRGRRGRLHGRRTIHEGEPRMRPRRSVLIALLVMVPITAFIAYISIILFPIQAQLAAPWLCDAPYSDLFVVADRVNKGTNHTMYCAGPRGERREVGWPGPQLPLWGVYYLVMAPIAGLIVYRRTRGR
ncbi:hypothetical protein ACFQY7_35350 [Actinomadura luteofluorescens]|uniref:Uncharacterized protein n=1 Tax=Actinomadura luteofluorescens TaxID=46163 RepID=A0A7Y9EK15_9ACTN|nr:hypothetical protein [Actinomadura luteofluorescens]NYD48976.1 hypothetical protein [Actinomadura luteofluorescens]